MHGSPARNLTVAHLGFSNIMHGVSKKYVFNPLVAKVLGQGVGRRDYPLASFSENRKL